MKNTALLLCLILFYASSFAQKCNCPKFTPKQKYENNEIGVDIAGLYRVESDFINEPFFIYYTKPAYISGLIYKRHYNKNAFRLGYDHYSFAYVTPNVRMFSYLDGKVKDDVLRVGYERLFRSGRFQPYIVADFVVNYIQKEGEWFAGGCFGPGEEGKYKARIIEPGLAHAMGLKYHINNKFSLTAEAGIKLGFAHCRNLLEPGYYNNYIRPQLDPLRAITLSYNF